MYDRCIVRVHIPTRMHHKYLHVYIMFTQGCCHTKLLILKDIRFKPEMHSKGHVGFKTEIFITAKTVFEDSVWKLKYTANFLKRTGFKSEMHNKDHVLKIVSFKSEIMHSKDCAFDQNRFQNWNAQQRPCFLFLKRVGFKSEMNSKNHVFWKKIRFQIWNAHYRPCFENSRF